MPAAEEIGDHAAEHAPALYQARVPCEDPAAAAALTAAGFAVVSVAITLAREPGPVEAGDAVEVRDADPEADRAVAEIAARGFVRSRFHLDPEVPRATADRIKRDWAQNALTGGRGDGMLVAVRGGEPVGFLAALDAETERGRARTIDLIAVAEGERGSGAGGALVARFVSEAEGDFDEVLVGTQAANPAATRFYERLGFTTLEAAFDLHLHAGDPRAGG